MCESTTASIRIGLCTVTLLLAAAGHAGADTQPTCTPPSGRSFPLLGEDAYRFKLVSKVDSGEEPVAGRLTLTELYTGILYGSLTYDRIGISIRVRGCVDAEQRLYLEEIDVHGKVTGRISAQLDPFYDYRKMEGTWHSGDGERSYEFKAGRDDSTAAEPAGLVCGDQTDLERVTSGDFEPLSDAEAFRAERGPLVAFGPFDPTVHGFRRVLVTYSRDCPPEADEFDKQNFTHPFNWFPCPVDVSMGVERETGTTWFRRTFAPEDADCHVVSRLAVAEAADLGVPRLKIATRCHVWQPRGGRFYRHASNYLIDFESGRPRATWRQRCLEIDCNSSRSSPFDRGQNCAWDREQADFLCRDELDDTAREFWLESGTPVQSHVRDGIDFPSLDTFLDAVQENRTTIERARTIQGIGPIRPIGGFPVGNDVTTWLFAAPGPRFYVLVANPGTPPSWIEIQEGRYQFSPDWRKPIQARLSIIPHDRPVAEGYTPESPGFRAHARSRETGVEGLFLVQVLTGERLSGEQQFITKNYLHDKPLSLHWVVLDARGPELLAQALLLVSRDRLWSSRCDYVNPKFLARVIDIEPGRGERLAKLTVAPPIKSGYARPARFSGRSCVVEVALDWTGTSGLQTEDPHARCETSDVCFGEPRIGKDGSFVPGAKWLDLSSELYDLWKRVDFSVALSRASQARKSFADRTRYCVSRELDVFIERFGFEGTPEEILTFLASVGRVGQHTELFLRALRETSDNDLRARHLRTFMEDSKIFDRLGKLEAQIDAGGGRDFVTALEEELTGSSGGPIDELRQRIHSRLAALDDRPPVPRMKATARIAGSETCQAPHPYRFAPLRATEIRSINFSPDGEHGWALDHDGAVLRLSNDRTRWDLADTVFARTGMVTLAPNGSSGTGWAFDGDGTILKFEAGDRRWNQSQQDPAAASIRAVALSESGETGWAVGRDGMILRLAKGGIRWDPIEPRITTRHLHDVALDEKRGTGWIGGDRGLILRLEDDGTRWTEFTAEDKHLTLHEIALNPHTGAGMAIGSTKGREKRIYKLVEDGTRWAMLEPRPAGEEKLQLTLDRLTATAWAVGKHGTVFRLSGGGRQWMQVGSPLPRPAWSDPNPLWSAFYLSALAVDPWTGAVWIAGDNGALLRLVRGGNTWEIVIPPMPVARNDRAVGSAQLDPENGTVLSLRGGGMLWLSHGGTDSKWQPSPEGFGWPQDVAFNQRKNTWWAVGGVGLILKRPLDEENWISMKRRATRQTLYGVAVDEKRATGWAIGQSVIVRTKPRRTRWVLADKHTDLIRDEQMTAIAIDPTTGAGWIVGHEGLVLRLTDDGNRWEAVEPRPTTGYLLDVAVDRQRNTFWAVGQYGTVLKAEGNSATWTSVEPRPTREDLSLVGVDERSGTLFVGTGTRLFRSADGGATWAEVDPMPMERITSLLFDGARSAGYAFGSKPPALAARIPDCPPRIDRFVIKKVPGENFLRAAIEITDDRSTAEYLQVAVEVEGRGIWKGRREVLARRSTLAGFGELDAWPLEQFEEIDVDRFRLTVSDGWNVVGAVADLPVTNAETGSSDK